MMFIGLMFFSNLSRRLLNNRSIGQAMVPAGFAGMVALIASNSALIAIGVGIVAFVRKFWWRRRIRGLVSMSYLTSAEHDQLSGEIKALERSVVGELVVVVAGTSDNYRFIPTLWAALLALILPGVYFLWQWLVSGGWPNPIPDNTELARVYIAQVTLFFGLLLLFHWAPIQRLIVPRSVLVQRARRLAREQFLVQRLHHTTERCGAMVFISLFEHHVEIMVDKGLSDKVDNGYWETTIADMSPLLKAGQTAQACSIAIDAVGQPMREFAARTTDSPTDNELPDHVIEL